MQQNIIYTFTQTAKSFTCNDTITPTVDGVYKGLLTMPNGNIVPVKCTYKKGIWVNCIMSGTMEGEEYKEDVFADSESKENIEIDNDEEIDDDIKTYENLPENAKTIKITQEQHKHINRISDVKRKKIIKYLLTLCPSLMKWLTIKLFYGQKMKYGGGKPGGGKPGTPKPVTDKDCMKKGIYKLANYSMIKGDIQAGKSDVMRVLAHFYYLCGLSSVLLLRNYNKDVEQMINGIVNFINKDIDSSLPRIEAFQCEKNMLIKNRKRYADALKGVKPAIFVLMANTTQIESFIELVKSVDNPPFVLLIDEADDISFFGDISKSSVDTVHPVYDNVVELKKSAVTTTGISATCFDNLFKEPELRPEFFFTLEKPNHYRGIMDISLGLDTRIMQENTNTQFINKADLVKGDDGLTKSFKFYFEKLTPLAPYYDESNVMHPINVLFKATTVIREHNRFHQYISTNPVTNKIWSSVIFNSVDINVYCPQLINKVTPYCLVPLKSKTSGLIVPGQYICGKKFGIRHVYTELRKTGCTHIVTFAGYLADRGINFVSLDYDMQVSHQYLDPADMSSATSRIQSLRMLGIHKHTAHIPMNLYCEEKVWHSIIKAYYIQEDIEKHTTNIDIKNPDLNGKSFPEIMEIVKFNPEKVPKIRLGKSKGTKPKIAKNGDKEFGDDIETFRKKISTIVEVDDKYKNKNGKSVDKEYEESYNEVGKEEFVRLTTRMFPKWSKSNTKISTFMQNLDPKKIYAEQEIKELCNDYGIQHLHQLTRHKIACSNGFGTILRKYNNKYNLHICLIDSYNLHFNYN
jgi:hypothetical protein